MFMFKTWERWLVIVHVSHRRSLEIVEPIWPSPLERGGLEHNFLNWPSTYTNTDCGEKETENKVVWKQEMEK